jgi:hypothetical protein
MSLDSRIATARSSGVATTGNVLTVVVTGKDGIRSFAFSYAGVPLPATHRSFVRQPSPDVLMVVAVGSPGSDLQWQVVDGAGNVVNNSSGKPAKRVTTVPNSGPAFDGIEL